MQDVAPIEAIRVLLADAHCLVRAGLRHVLEDDPAIQVVAEAASVVEVLVGVENFQPRVAVLDVTLADGGGIKVCQQIVRQYPNLPVLILSAHPWEVYRVRAWKAGAAGFVLKTSQPHLLLQAVRTVAQGLSLWSHEQMQHIWAWQQAVTKRLAPLTPREKEVLALLVRRQTNPEIAAALSISEKTVETHVSNVLGKLAMDSRREVIAWAERTKLFAP